MSCTDSGGFYRESDVVRKRTSQGRATRLPIGPTAWRKGQKKGIYPKPVKFGGLNVYPKEVIHDLERRIAAGELAEAMGVAIKAGEPIDLRIFGPGVYHLISGREVVLELEHITTLRPKYNRAGLDCGYSNPANLKKQGRAAA